MIICIYQEVNYTGRNVIGKDGIPNLVNYSSEINLLVNSMYNSLGLRYTTLLINFHHQKQGENTVRRSNVNLAFRRLLPQITKT